MATTSEANGDHGPVSMTVEREQIRQTDADLRNSLEASDRALASLTRAVPEVLRLVVPGAVLRPVESLDLVFDLVQQMLTIQRHLLNELLGQTRSMIDAGIDDDVNDHRARERNDGRRGSTTGSRRSARSAA